MSMRKNWVRRSALAALLTALGAAAHAQDAPPAPPIAPTAPMAAPDSTPPAPPMVTPGDMNTNPGMSSGVTTANDYRLLSSPYYDYVDLKTAMARGYSLSQLGVISKIARLTGLPFRFVTDRVSTGRTFALLASDYNLRLGDVLDALDEQARIEEYLRLYESLNSLGTVHSTPFTYVDTTTGPTLAELESRYTQLNAQFPALPPTNIETTPIGSSTTTTTTETVTPTVAAAPPPPPPAPPVTETEVIRTVTTHTRVRHHARRHHARRVHHVRRHRHMPSYMSRGS